MAAYYNEFDPFAAQWLRELIKAGLIADGDVDERDMRTVEAGDLVGYTQCHFFAGIGGWSYALRLAGWPDDRPVWTGSPPCQPFSSAGKQLGVQDERHLAPHFLELVKAGRPPVVIGEQVATAVKKDAWLDDLLDGLEAENYATGAIVLPACGLGSPHIRQRLWFVAERVADAERQQRQWRGPSEARNQPGQEQRTERFCNARRMDNPVNERLEGHPGHGDNSDQPGRIDAQPAGSATPAGSDSGMADAGYDAWAARTARGVHKPQTPVSEQFGSESPISATHAPTTGWDTPDWIFCRDEKWRPIESIIEPRLDGLSDRLGYSRFGDRYSVNPLIEKAENRVGRLKGYGNAIVPTVAAEVIRAYLEG